MLKLFLQIHLPPLMLLKLTVKNLHMNIMLVDQKGMCRMETTAQLHSSIRQVGKGIASQKTQTHKGSELKHSVSPT